MIETPFRTHKHTLQRRQAIEPADFQKMRGRPMAHISEGEMVPVHPAYYYVPKLFRDTRKCPRVPDEPF